MVPERKMAVRVGSNGVYGWEYTYPLHIEADIIIPGSSEPNSANVKIFNLSPPALKVLESKGLVVQVLAGDGILSNLFTGDVKKYGVTTKREGASICTTILARDFGKKFIEQDFCRAYPPNTARSLVLSDIISSMGTPVGYMSPTLKPITFPTGITLVGPTRRCLEEVLLFDLSTYKIINESIYIYSESDFWDGMGAPNTMVVVSDETGMIESPERDTEGNIKVKCRLNTGICKLHQIFQLKSLNINGIFQVKSIAHKVVSDGSVWETEISARQRQVA
jgi:hypothetical protein